MAPVPPTRLPAAVSFNQWASSPRLLLGRFPRGFEPKRSLKRPMLRVLEGDMSERRITQLFGLILGGIFTCTLVLSAFAY